MLLELFAQKINSNFIKREMNCSKNCNSKLRLISDNWNIYPFDRWFSKLVAHNQLIEKFSLDISFDHMQYFFYVKLAMWKLY